MLSFNIFTGQLEFNVLNKKREAVMAAPQNLIATNEDQNIALSWDAVDGATVYRLLVNSVDDVNTAWEEAFNIAGTTYDFVPELDNGGATDSINVGQKCYFWVAVNDGTTGVSLSDPSASANGRAFITVGAMSNIYVRAPGDAGGTFANLIFGASPLPDLYEISKGGLSYVSFSGVWYETVGYSDVSSTAITGAFNFANTTGSPFTFWNTEP